jgi:hypothetical protein
VDDFISQGSSIATAPLLPRSEFDIGVTTTFVQLGFLWILAHELGHAHLGHLTGRRFPARMIDESPDEEDESDEAFAAAQELEADAFAASVTKGICRMWGCNPGLSGLAASMILQVYGSAYARLADHYSPHAPHDAVELAIRATYRHPTPRERLARLLSPHDAAENWAIHVAARLDGATSIRAARQHHPRWTPLCAALRGSR